MREKINRWLKKSIINLFELEKFDYKEISIEPDVVDDILEMAKNAFPREYAALLGGKIEKKVLVIDSILVMLHGYQSSKNATSMLLDAPMLSGVVGSVHSHPSPNNNPSQADMHFFGKTGFVHLIIGHPYKQENIAVYNIKGEKIELRIKNKKI